MLLENPSGWLRLARPAPRAQGHRVGPMTLFFGGRHAHAEYYYRDERLGEQVLQTRGEVT